MSSVDSVLDRVRTLQDAQRRLTALIGQHGQYPKEREDQLARSSAENVTCVKQVDKVREACRMEREAKLMSQMNPLGDCNQRLTSMVMWLGDQDATKKPYSDSGSAMVTWHNRALPTVGTTVTEWKQRPWAYNLRVTPGDGLPVVVVSEGKAALSVPPAGMLTSNPTLPLLGRTVVVVFRFPPDVPMVGTVLARRAEPPAPGMTFLACNGKNVVHGVFHTGRWITTEGMTLPESGGPILVVYQYDVADTLRLRYVQPDGKVVSVPIGGAPVPPLLPLEGPVPLTVGGYRATEGGAVLTDRGSPLLMHLVQVYSPRSDADIVAVFFAVHTDWSTL